MGVSNWGGVKKAVAFEKGHEGGTGYQQVRQQGSSWYKIRGAKKKIMGSMIGHLLTPPQLQSLSLPQSTSLGLPCCSTSSYVCWVEMTLPPAPGVDPVWLKPIAFPVLDLVIGLGEALEQVNE